MSMYAQLVGRELGSVKLVRGGQDRRADTTLYFRSQHFSVCCGSCVKNTDIEAEEWQGLNHGVDRNTHRTCCGEGRWGGGRGV